MFRTLRKIRVCILFITFLVFLAIKSKFHKIISYKLLRIWKLEVINVYSRIHFKWCLANSWAKCGSLPIQVLAMIRPFLLNFVWTMLGDYNLYIIIKHVKSWIWNLIVDFGILGKCWQEIGQVLWNPNKKMVHRSTGSGPF